jgi:YggT family protein
MITQAAGLTVLPLLISEPAMAALMYEVADLDSNTAGLLATLLRPVLAITTLLMIVRIVLTWYPQVRHFDYCRFLSVAKTLLAGLTTPFSLQVACLTLLSKGSALGLQVDVSKLPWLIVYAPTEPVLDPTRKLVPPVGGVDVSPIIWVALLSFINEILIGPQGILNLLQRKVEVF